MRRLWLLLTIPLILGCIMGGGEEEIEFAGCVPEVTNGLAITSFEPDLGEIYSNEDVTLTLELENLGGSKATGIEAEILNYGILALSGGDTIVQTVSDIEVSEEGMPAVTDQADWTMMTEGLATTGTETVTPAATVSYDYTSTGIAMLKFIPKSDWRDMRQDGETVTIAKTCSNGPLAVSVAPLRVPITEDSGEFTTQVVIKNIGGGKVRTGAIDKLGTITLTLPTGNELKVGSVCDFTGTPLTATGTLNRNGELTLTCKLMLDDDVAQTVREAEYEVKVEVEYTYVIDGTTSVIVNQEAKALSMKYVSAATFFGNDMAFNTSEDAALGYENITVTFEPIYGGDPVDDTAMADYTATIKNDLTAAEDLSVLNLTWDAGTDRSSLVIGVPTPDDTKLYTEDATLSIELEYDGRKASLIVEDIDVIE